MGLLVGGCAQLAGLGEGTETAGNTPAGNVDGGGTEARTDANITISPATLDYGAVACGTDSPEKLISITNNGSLRVDYEVQLPEGTAFRLGPDAKGILAPKQSKTIAVIANARLAGDNVADLFVSAGQALQQLHLTAKGSGPTFELTQSTIAFGDVRKENGGAPVDIEVKNSGTEALSVAQFTTSDPAFDVQWSAKPGAFTVAPGASGTFKVALLTATSPDGAALSGTIKPTTTKICGAPPILTVSGRRVTSEVTVNPADWGAQSCGTTPASKNVVITNYANAIVTYTIDQGASPSFVATDMSGGSVPAAPNPQTPQTGTIRVVPKPLATAAPLPNVNEKLGVVLGSTGPGISGRRDVALHVDTRGAIVTITPATLALTSDGSNTDSKPFTVTNTGNELVYLNWSFQRTNAKGATSWSYSTPNFLAAGGSGNGKVDFKGVDQGDATATLTPSQPILFRAPECKPLGSLAVTGTKP
ncbi:hypothetical protein BH11MYX4_BH11MYX4_56450 [soil metagenome]